MNIKRSFCIFGVTGSDYLWISFQFHTLCTILLLIVIQNTAVLAFVYNIPYRRARAWPSARASKGILHTMLAYASDFTF